MANTSMDLLSWLRKQLAETNVDLLRESVRAMVEALMSAEADAICGAPLASAVLTARMLAMATVSRASV